MDNIIVVEMVGTALLILLGDGVVANVLLNKSKGQNSGWIVITFGWGLAVMVGAYAAGATGAHLNPAVTIGFAAEGLIEWSDVPLYTRSASSSARSSVQCSCSSATTRTGPRPRTRGSSWLCSPPVLPSATRSSISSRRSSAPSCCVFGIYAIAVGRRTESPVGWSATSAASGRSWSAFWSSASACRSAVPRGTPSTRPATSGRGSCTPFCPSRARASPTGSYSWIPVVGPIIGGVLGALAAGAFF